MKRCVSNQDVVLYYLVEVTICMVDDCMCKRHECLLSWLFKGEGLSTRVGS